MNIKQKIRIAKLTASSKVVSAVNLDKTTRRQIIELSKNDYEEVFEEKIFSHDPNCFWLFAKENGLLVFALRMKTWMHEKSRKNVLIISTPFVHPSIRKLRISRNIIFLKGLPAARFPRYFVTWCTGPKTFLALSNSSKAMYPGPGINKDPKRINFLKSIRDDYFFKLCGTDYDAEEGIVLPSYRSTTPSESSYDCNYNLESTVCFSTLNPKFKEGYGLACAGRIF